MNIEGEYVVFSGELSCMSKKQAKALIYSLGGYNQQTVNKRTTLLVTGLFKTQLFSKESQYKEKRKAESLAMDGYPIQIIDEKKFLVIANKELVTCIRRIYQRDI